MKTIRIIFLAVITASIVFLTTCQKEKVSGISLNKTELYLSPGDMEKLAVTIYPEDADNKKVVWDSDNPTVATVNDDGLVTAMKDGAAVITVTTMDGNHTASCAVSVDYRAKWIGDWDFEIIAYSWDFEGETRYSTYYHIGRIDYGDADDELTINYIGDYLFTTQVDESGMLFDDNYNGDPRNYTQGQFEGENKIYIERVSGGLGGGGGITVSGIKIEKGGKK